MAAPRLRSNGLRSGRGHRDGGHEFCRVILATGNAVLRTRSQMTALDQSR